MHAKCCFLFNVQSSEGDDEIEKREYQFEGLHASFKVTDPIPSMFSVPSLPGLWFTVIDHILPNIQTPIYYPPLVHLQVRFEVFCWLEDLLLNSGYGHMGGCEVLI